MQAANYIPKFRRHRPTGQAVVTLDGRDFYLGPWRSAAARAEYDRMIAEWIAAGRRLPVDPMAVTIAEVAAAFRRHAQTYYRSADGTIAKEASNIDDAMRLVLRLYGKTPAVEFGPLRLKAVREAMIAAGHVRTGINRMVTRIRGVFNWAVENELVPSAIAHGLAAVKGLRQGRSEATESQPVKPVPTSHVETTLPHCNRQVAAMIRLQLLTGMRPGEVTIMRGCDIDTTGKLWVYKPAHHKTQHHGIDRNIYLGPKAQEIVRPFLKTDLAACLFAPADAEAERRAKMHAERKTPITCGHRPGNNQKRKPKRVPGQFYRVEAYHKSIAFACDAAGTPRWSPNQLRHTAATLLRKEHGLEAAQVILGHKTLTVTQVYAEKNIEEAQRVMALVG